MSDMSSATGGQPSSNGIVRGQGHAPGQNLGEAMPDAPKVEQKSLGDMRNYFRERNAGRQEPTARNRVAEFSKQLEARQQGAQRPQQDTPRGQEGTPEKTESMGDPNQLKEPGNVNAPQEGQQPTEETGSEQQPTEGEEQEPLTLSDRDALAKFREWEQSGMFPEELESKWIHELKANGVMRYVDTKELKQGYIRGIDYRQGFEQIKAREESCNAKEQAWNQHFTDVKDPQTMLDVYEREGYEDTLMGVAKLLAERDRDDRLQINGAGYAAMQRYGTNDPNDHRVVAAMQRCQERIAEQRKASLHAKRLEFREQQLKAEQEAQRSQQTVQQLHQQYDRQLNQLRPIAFKAFGFPDNPKNRAEFISHLGARLKQDGMPEGGITQAVVMAAARDMAEAREGGNPNQPPVGLSPQQWARVKAQQRSRANNQELPPQRMGAGGGKPMGGANGAKRGNLADFQRAYKDKTLGR